MVQSRPEVARAVSDALAEAGVEAIVVTDGHAAVEAVTTWAPDVVLVDLTLAPLDGWYVVAALGTLRDRPLVVVRVADRVRGGTGRAARRRRVGRRRCPRVAAAGKLVPQIAA